MSGHGDDEEFLRPAVARRPDGDSGPEPCADGPSIGVHAAVQLHPDGWCQRALHLRSGLEPDARVSEQLRGLHAGRHHQFLGQHPGPVVAIDWHNQASLSGFALPGDNDGPLSYYSGGLFGTNNAQFSSSSLWRPVFSAGVFTGYYYGPSNCEDGEDCGPSKVHGTLPVTTLAGNAPEPGSLALFGGALALLVFAFARLWRPLKGAAGERRPLESPPPSRRSIGAAFVSERLSRDADSPTETSGTARRRICFTFAARLGSR